MYEQTEEDRMPSGFVQWKVPRDGVAVVAQLFLGRETMNIFRLLRGEDEVDDVDGGAPRVLSHSCQGSVATVN